jgi:hypothetical protein
MASHHFCSIRIDPRSSVFIRVIRVQNLFSLSILQPMRQTELGGAMQQQFALDWCNERRNRPNRRRFAPRLALRATRDRRCRVGFDSAFYRR